MAAAPLPFPGRHQPEPWPIPTARTAILVAGATGLLGTDICQRLRARGHRVRALVRPTSTAKASALAALGVDIITGDLRNHDDIARACSGISAVITTATAMGAKDKKLKLRDIDGAGQLALIAAARVAGVAHFILISASPNLTDAAPLIRYKRAAERALRASGMRWTILQPSVFMEVWLSPLLGWDIPRGTATVFGPGTAPLQWISVGDVAEVAVRALDDPRLTDRVIPLGGPEAIAPNEVIRRFEHAATRRFKVRRIPLAMLRLLKPIAGLFQEGVASGMSMGAQTAALGDRLDPAILHELGIQPVTLDQHIARAIAR